jgi:hypothetical protein
LSLDTYANLQTSIADWLVRPGDTIITTIAPDLITLFEAEARDRLKSRFAETETTLSTVAGTATVALPSDFWEARALKISSSDPVAHLVYMTPDELDTEWPFAGDRGQPVNFTIQGTNLRLAPVPDAVYTLTLLYQQGITALSDAAPTNWLLTRYPDLYLTGSLSWAEAYIADDERVAGWVSAKEAAFNRIAQSDIKARWGGGSLQIRTDTGNP